MPAKPKIGTHVRSDASGDELAFLKQLGIEYVRVHIPDSEDPPDTLRRVRSRFESAGLRIASCVNLLYQAPEIAFGLPERDRILDRLATFIRAMGNEGIPTLEYDFFLYAPLPETGTVNTRGARARQFDLAAAEKLPPITRKAFSPGDMWDHHAHMLETLLPAAEDAGVRLALHPDDPPLPTLLGVPRIFGTLESLDRVLNQFPSPNLGILFCVGTWAEGGNAWGANLCDAIRHFAGKKRLFSVHFRNVSGTLPRFHETFLDNGDVNMKHVMRTLEQVGFDGLIIPDHCPELAGDTNGHAALAHAIGYMTALLENPA